MPTSFRVEIVNEGHFFAIASTRQKHTSSSSSSSSSTYCVRRDFFPSAKNKYYAKKPHFCKREHAKELLYTVYVQGFRWLSEADCISGASGNSEWLKKKTPDAMTMWASALRDLALKPLGAIFLQPTYVCDVRAQNFSKSPSGNGRHSQDERTIFTAAIPWKSCMRWRPIVETYFFSERIPAEKTQTPLDLGPETMLLFSSISGVAGCTTSPWPSSCWWASTTSSSSWIHRSTSSSIAASGGSSGRALKIILWQLFMPAQKAQFFKRKRLN